MRLEKRSPSPQPSPPGEGEAGTVPGNFHALWCGIASWGLTSAATEKLSIFRHGFARAQTERPGEFAGLRQHHAGFAGDGDELKAFLNAALRGVGVQHVYARRDPVL